MNRIGRLAAAAVLATAGLAFGEPPFPVLPPNPEASQGAAPAPFAPPPAAEPVPVEDYPVWADAAYLIGWVRGDRLPPLVTTSPAGTVRTAAGVLGQNGTNTLFGFNSANTQSRSGLRADAGWWFDQEQGLGVEFGLFALESAGQSFAAASAGDPILARPYFDVSAGAPASSLIAFPGVSSGSILVSDTARNFFGFNADLCENVTASDRFRLDALLGYQFLRYDERLRIVESTQPTEAPFAAGTSMLATDDFSTENIFNGLDMGFRARLYYEALTLDLLGKVAAGHVDRHVGIVGETTTSVPGSAPTTSQGGLLALSSNIGSHSNGQWTAAPQFGVNLGWQVRPNVRVYTGYSVLWWLNVVRPGDQVDLNVNPALIPPATTTATASSPAFTGVTSGLWVQTLAFGVEVRY